MKRLFTTILICALLCALSVSAMAADSVTGLSAAADVQTDGSVRMSVSLQLHLDSAVSQLNYPLPANAGDVRVNGAEAKTTASSQGLQVALPAANAGDYRFTVEYTLYDAVDRGLEEAVVTLPLLSGFDYPITAMEFTVTLPGQILEKPVYLSGYHQNDIENAIESTLSGNSLTGTVGQTLKDHETLTLTLTAAAGDFPHVLKIKPLLDGWDGTVLLCAVLAVVYYLLTLLSPIYRRTRCFSPPEGISAGEIGTCLTGTGADLTLMVITWAQLGYLRMHLEGKKRVMLYKQMDMGNERSQFENRVFQSLFSKRSVVDGTGVHYAKLFRKVAAQAPMRKQMMKPRSGNVAVFRVLACCAGAVSGVKLGLAISDQAALQVLLGILICLLCGLFSYCIQGGGRCLPMRNKAPLWLALGCSALWLGLGFLTGQLAYAIPNVLFQLVCGLAVALGGRRSELGKRSVAQIHGLRHHMVRANTFDLQKRLEANPFYFYELTPYALALGVDKRFARRFGKAALPDCGFLHTDGKQPVTASQWAALLRQTADRLNARQKKLFFERITGKI